jgi:hypothetical protein
MTERAMAPACGMAPMVDILGRLKAVRRGGKGWTARCPAHDDQQNSLSITRGDGKWLLMCHAGCNFEAVIAAFGLNAEQLFDQHGEGSSIPAATGQSRNRRD